MRNTTVVLLVTLSGTFGLACDDTSHPTHDATADVPAETETGADADADADVEPDLGADADAEAEADADVEPDVVAETEADADAEAEAEVWPVPAVEWAVGFGAAADDGLAALDEDALGRVVAAGFTGAGTVDFGDGPRGPFAYQGLFVAAWDADGALRWALRPVALGNAAARGVVVGASGTSYVCAEFHNTLDLGGGRTATSAGGTDVAIFALDADGNALWLDSFGGTGNEFCQALAADEALDRVWVTGAYMFGVDFGDGELPTGSSSTNGFLAALDTEGTVVWSRGWVTDQPADNGGVAADATGNVYVTGAFLDSTDFFGTVRTATTSQDVFVLSLDPAGSFRWVRQYSGGYSEIGQEVVPDGAGGVAVLATFEGTMPVGSATLTARGAYDTALWTLDAGGTVGWALSFGDVGYDSGIALVRVDDGYVMGGWLRGATSFGGPMLESGAADDGFLVGLDAAGHHRWTAGFGGERPVYVAAAAPAGGGDVFAGGIFYGALTLGATTVSGGGERDVFLLRLSPDAP